MKEVGRELSRPTFQVVRETFEASMNFKEFFGALDEQSVAQAKQVFHGRPYKVVGSQITVAMSPEEFDQRSDEYIRALNDGREWIGFHLEGVGVFEPKM